MAADLTADAAQARRWWETLRPQLTPDVAGLWFGIVTASSDSREVLTLCVAGTATFNVRDETAEWAAGESTWQPDRRYVVLPVLAALPEQPFEVPLAHAVAVLREVAPWRDLPSVGVAVGYDDGDFVLLHDGE